ncbi:MAG: cytochrome c [Polyangiaceae bacterium]|nr:cytochrome c [Polyangiaceae bacterium]
MRIGRRRGSTIPTRTTARACAVALGAAVLAICPHASRAQDAPRENGAPVAAPIEQAATSAPVSSAAPAAGTAAAPAAGPAAGEAPAAGTAAAPAAGSAAAPAAGAAPAPAAGAAPAPAPAAGGAPADAAASPAAVLFGKKCSGCHSIGEGDRTGPDLLGVTQRRQKAWLSGFIRNAGAVIDSGDAVANEMLTKFKGVRMPEQTLGDDDLAALIEYLGECDAKGGCKIVTGQMKKASEATPAEIASGRLLFEGSRPLTNGGAACISCHHVRGVGLLGGGTLAKDLTFVYARLGDTALGSALETTPFPLMKDIYSKQALTGAEAFQLKAFLYSASLDGTQPSADHNFFYLGFCGLGAALGLIGATWSGRMRHGVRRRLVSRTPARPGARGAT